MNRKRCFSISSGLLILAGMALAGCVAQIAPSHHMADAKHYVREHRGEGLRRSVLGSEAELMSAVIQIAEQRQPDSGLYPITILREPHAVFLHQQFLEYKFTCSFAFYFDPSQKSGHTDVELLYACLVLDDKKLLAEQHREFLEFLAIPYLEARLLEAGYDPNVMEGGQLPLSWAALHHARSTATKLLQRGANVELAIDQLQAISLGLRGATGLTAKRRSEQANVGVALLTKLSRQAKRGGLAGITEARFQEAVALYQGAAAKPQLPESARQFLVQAGSATREKAYQEAADLYEQGLAIAPWSPEGHFNLALVLAELEELDSAILEMTRYLALVPTASDARAARDKIYDWQRKAAK